MILYCLRHGQAEHNINHLMNGDPSKPYHLTELGKQQAIETRGKLKDISFDIIITSEMPRAIETAKIINKNNVNQVKDKRLNDLDSGVEEKTYKEYKAEQKRLAEIQNIDTRDVRINKGESFNDEKNRIWNFLKELKIKNYKNVLLIAHFDTIIAIDEYANKNISQNKPKNCEIFRFEI